MIDTRNISNEELNRMTNLKELDLNSDNINDEGIRNSTNLTSLQFR